MDAQQPVQQPAPQPVTAFDVLFLNNQKLEAIDRTAVNISPLRGFVFGEVSTHEATELERLDEKEEPTGEKYAAILLTLKSGKEIELSPEEAEKFFFPLWNEKTTISHQSISGF